MEERLCKLQIEKDMEPSYPSLIKHYMWYIMVRIGSYSILQIASSILISANHDDGKKDEKSFAYSLHVFSLTSVIIFIYSTIFFKELKVSFS